MQSAIILWALINVANFTLCSQPKESILTEESYCEDVSPYLFVLTDEETKDLYNNFIDPPNLLELPKNAFNALDLAAFKGHLNFCKFLLSKGFPVNDNRHLGGISPLHLATIGGHFEICKLLIAFKANVDATVKDRSVLFLAINQPSIFKLLLDNNASDPLQAIAIQPCSSQIYNLVLEKIKEIDFTKDSTKEALKTSCNVGNAQTCKFILENGKNNLAIPAAFKNCCRECLKSAALKGHTDTCRLLCTWLSKHNLHLNVDAETLTKIAEENFLETLKVLVDHGCFLEKKQWPRLLEKAAEKDDVPLCEFIASQAFSPPRSANRFSNIEQPVMNSVENTKKRIFETITSVHRFCEKKQSWVSVPLGIYVGIKTAVFLSSFLRTAPSPEEFWLITFGSLIAGYLPITTMQKILKEAPNIAHRLTKNVQKHIGIRSNNAYTRLLTVYTCLYKKGILMPDGSLLKIPKDVTYLLISYLEADITEILNKIILETGNIEVALPKVLENVVIKHLTNISTDKLMRVAHKIIAKPNVSEKIKAALNPSNVHDNFSASIKENLTRRVEFIEAIP